MVDTVSNACSSTTAKRWLNLQALPLHCQAPDILRAVDAAYSVSDSVAPREPVSGYR